MVEESKLLLPAPDESEAGIRNWALSISPPKMAVILSLVVFTAELGVMLLLDRLPDFPPVTEALIDSCILIAFLVPAYLVLYRPFWQARRRDEEEIRRLNARLTDANEDERRRIALDLQDHCDQTLVALHRTVELVQLRVLDKDEEAAALCQEIDELLGRLNHDVRAVSAALHPPHFDEEGLGAALSRHIAQMKKKGPPVDFVEKGEARVVDQQQAITLYRIVQESLRNASRHSGATLIRVFLEYLPDSVAVSVVDNGRGFDVKSAIASGGLGLIGLRERMRARNGKLFIHSEPGRGTSIRASFKV